MMKNEPHVIKVPTLQGRESILIYVESASQKTTLDVKLYATDGNNVYTLKNNLNEKNVLDIRGQAYRGSDAEWLAIISWFLLQQSPSTDFSQSVANAEIAGDVKSGQSLELRIRQQISGITQRLGSIMLECNNDIEIELFDWAGIAAAAHNTSLIAQSEMQAKYDSQQRTIDKLKAQLNDVIQAKKLHEDQMLEKFRQLMNTKKLKIRDQQRLLATASIDAKAAESVRQEREGATEAKSASNKGSKKRSKDEDSEEVKQEDISQDISEDEGFEKDHQTTDASETEDEAGESSSNVPNATNQNRIRQSNISQPQKVMQRTNNLQLPTDQQNATAPAAKGSHSVDEEETDDEL